MIEGGGGGYLKNMGAISGGQKKFGIKNNSSSTPPSNLNYDWSLSIYLQTKQKKTAKQISKQERTKKKKKKEEGKKKVHSGM